MTFDPEKRGSDRLKVTNNDYIARYEGEKGYGNKVLAKTVFHPGNIYYFEILIINGLDIRIGLATTDYDIKSSMNKSD